MHREAREKNEICVCMMRQKTRDYKLEYGCGRTCDT
jgi:hypothetical protein